jgi:hypothetical protein
MKDAAAAMDMPDIFHADKHIQHQILVKQFGNTPEDGERHTYKHAHIPNNQHTKNHQE